MSDPMELLRWSVCVRMRVAVCPSSASAVNSVLAKEFYDFVAVYFKILI
jgi:hypothetical protein